VTKAAGPLSAYVLHQWAWSETSVVLDLFTREQGRVAAVAKGAKRPYSQLRSVLLPFQRIAVLLGRVKADEASDIVNLRSADYTGGVPSLPTDCLFSGFYLNELLMKLLARQDAHPRLFDAYGETLGALATQARSEDEATLRAFELMLLRETGVLPELDCSTLTQEPLQPDRGYALRPESGLVQAAADELSLSAAQCQALETALQAQHAQALRQATTAALPALKAQLRAVLAYHLGSPQLRSRQAMLEVRRLLDAPVERSSP
jgi:DNA repair protein RecO (recombination protein O)